MGNKKRKNKKRKNKNKNNKKDKKKIKKVSNKLVIEDIFLFEDIYVKDANKVINMEIKNIYKKKISLKNLDSNKIILNKKISNIQESKINLEDNCNQSELIETKLELKREEYEDKICDIDIYQEILNELKKYKNQSLDVDNTYINIPLNNWGEWIYI